MSIPEQLPLAARSHNNQQLFSDYYLEAVVPERADWKALTRQAEPVMRAIAGIFAGYRPTSNENQTEDYLINSPYAAPVLDGRLKA